MFHVVYAVSVILPYSEDELIIIFGKHQFWYEIGMFKLYFIKLYCCCFVIFREALKNKNWKLYKLMILKQKLH